MSDIHDWLAEPFSREILSARVKHVNCSDHPTLKQAVKKPKRIDLMHSVRVLLWLSLPLHKKHNKQRPASKFIAIKKCAAEKVCTKKQKEKSINARKKCGSGFMKTFDSIGEHNSHANIYIFLYKQFTKIFCVITRFISYPWNMLRLRAAGSFAVYTASFPWQDFCNCSYQPNLIVS